MVLAVKLRADAFMVCLTHALSTEEEEVMGLLIGEVVDDCADVSAVSMLRRSDKRKDRVEISPEQLAMGAQEAEHLAIRLQKPMRVVGWYHSHPHITMWPSHVDVRTQSIYQTMDSGFFGLIFSCFNHDAQSMGHIDLTCFQSVTSTTTEGQEILNGRDLPVHICRTSSISQPCLEALSKLPRILLEEEQEALHEAERESSDLLSRVHNGSVFAKSLSRFMEIICGPIMQALESRLEHHERKIKQLKAEKTRLKEALT